MKDTYVVYSWVEGDKIVFECPTCDQKLNPIPRVDVHHSPAKCSVCGKKFQVDLVVKVIDE